MINKNLIKRLLDNKFSLISILKNNYNNQKFHIQQVKLINLIIIIPMSLA